MQLTIAHPNVWWVNQGSTLAEEYREGMMWAPLRSSNGGTMYHWETMTEVREGDIVLHYSNKALRYVSHVLKAAVEARKPSSLSSSNWNERGRLVLTKYYELQPPIPLQQFNLELMKLHIEQGPLHSGSGVKQGYLFRFTIEGLQLIQRLSGNVNWPDFTRNLHGKDDGSEVGSLIEDASLHKPEDNEVKLLLGQIKSYISAQGFTYPDHLIENFYLSLKTKPFVILAGVSGTGKTKLIQLFAEAVGATKDNGRYQLIPVRPDWSDPSDLIGYQDLSGVFRPGKLTEVLHQASHPENQDKPFFICLDEMNLARVEHYFSDLLSILETQKWEVGRIRTQAILSVDRFSREEDQEKYGGLYIPDNVYLIGTVNMDETTHPFSKKVLDRANTIEFNDINLSQFPDMADRMKGELAQVDNAFLRSDYLQLIDAYETYSDLVKTTTARLVEVNRILESVHAHVGFRIRDAVCFYMIYNERFQLLSQDDAFDVQLLQKILPRIQGSHFAVKKALLQLLQLCVTERFSLEDALDDAMEICSRWDAGKTPPDAKYPQSARKLAYMLRRYEDDGFTSYWLS